MCVLTAYMYIFWLDDLAAGMHTCNLGIVQWLNGSTIHKLREYKYGYFSILAVKPHMIFVFQQEC